MTSEMDTLVALSREFGGDPEFILAGGGNTSVKDADRLRVKASGHALATIEADGFVAMDRSALAAILERDFGDDVDVREARFKEAVLAARREPEKGQRPSVECVLHHLMPGRFVVHTHSTYANMITCCRKGEALFKELFGNEYVWVDFADPGFMLAKAVDAAVKAYQQRTGRAGPAAVLMQNHGLIVCGDTPEQIRERTDRVIAAIRERVAGMSDAAAFGTVTTLDAEVAHKQINVIGPALRGLLATDDRLKIVTFDDSEVVMQLVGGPEGRATAMGGPLSPDQIVYCKAFPLWFETRANESPAETVQRLRQAIEAHRSERGFAPEVVLVEGVGLFGQGDDFAAADRVRAVYVDAIKVMAAAKRLGAVRYMSKRDREFLEHWEVEAYRRGIAAAGQPQGRAAGRVTMVTGAAQGVGLAIARDLVKAGGYVVLADINAVGAQQAADELGPGQVMGLGVDVTRGESLAEAVHQTVRRYGGFDVFIANAGVLKAGSVKTLPIEDFEFVTNVNYKGYFLCVQNAAPVLAVQHQAKGDWWGDIIQINSKSGLEGSNKNAAYAGSKFGGIGLTQSFALELIADGIKVNAICPGNFFDGPLWSDPEHGLFVQYLKAGKVPGAESVQDVRRFYEAKVPMGRGCTVGDVMKAIYYLIEQTYETGQALPVTGGQVMLR